MANKPWKEEELSILKDCFENKKLSQLRKLLPGRDKKSIRRKSISLGWVVPKYKVTKVHTKKKWTDEEIAKLKSIFSSTNNLNKTKIPGRSRDSIRGMLLRLDLISTGPSKKAWKKKEEELLIRLSKRQKKTAKEIFELKVLPYSRNSIQKKMCYMGLTKKSRKINKIPLNELPMFKKFLNENWQGKTPEELVIAWNNKAFFKVNKSRVLYHLNALGCKISYGEVARIKNLRKKEEEVKQRTHKNQKELDEDIRLLRINMMRSRISKGKDIWTGLQNEEAKLEDI